MDYSQRIVLFFGVCLPIRSYMAYIASTAPKKSWTLTLLSVMYLFIGLQMLRLWFYNQRLNAPEAGGGTWWASIRPLHAFLYIAFALSVLSKRKALVENAHRFLQADIILALIAWITLNPLSPLLQ